VSGVRIPWSLIRKIGLWTGVVVVTVALVGTVLGVWAVRRSFPEHGGTLRLAGLTAPVTVHRDGHGIPQLYAQTAEANSDNASLTAVDVRPSRLSGVRKIVEVIFSYTNRQTDVTDKYFVRVDVTEEFPFLVTKLSPFYEH